MLLGTVHFATGCAGSDGTANAASGNTEEGDNGESNDNNSSKGSSQENDNGDASSLSWTPLGPEGWSSYEPHADTVKIFVSSSQGDDTHTGMSKEQPVRTIARALELARERSAAATIARPDWILFKAGDSWHESFQLRVDTIKGGLNIEYPFILTSYGDGDRPRFIWAEAGPLWGYGWWGGDYPTGDSAPAYWSIMGLDFHTPTKDPTSDRFDPTRVYDGSNPPVVAFQNQGHHILFEDCRFRYTALIVQGGSDHVALRRNLFLDNYGYHDHTDTNSVYHHAQGLYVNEVEDLLIEENFFDHNGWLDETKYPTTAPTIFNHNAYLDASVTKVMIHANITARASADGFKARGGATVNNNLCLENGINININERGTLDVEQTARYNVVLDALALPLHGPEEYSGHLPRAWGINFGTITESRLDATGNIVAHSEFGSAPISGSCAAFPACVAGHLVHSWGPFPNSAGSFPDPDRSISTYMTSIGQTASLDAFLTEARLQARSNWRREYTAKAVNSYIRAGFGVAMN